MNAHLRSGSVIHIVYLYLFDGRIIRREAKEPRAELAGNAP
jgi:hypothetical protein